MTEPFLYCIRYTFSSNKIPKSQGKNGESMCFAR